MTHLASDVTPRRDHLGSRGGGNLWTSAPMTMHNTRRAVQFSCLSPQLEASAGDRNRSGVGDTPSGVDE
jgi:hypothetical protein